MKINRIIFILMIAGFFCFTKIHASQETKPLVDKANGYSLDLPFDVEFDFSFNPIFVKAQSNSFYVTISKEESPYEDIDYYIDYYLNRFMLNKEYQESNNIIFKENITKFYNNYNMQIISLVLDKMNENKFDAYTYVIIKTGSSTFYRLMFKYNSKDETFATKLETALSSFNIFKPTEKATYNMDFKPIIPETWSEETLKLYNDIKNLDEIKWGIYVNDIYKDGINLTIPEIEQKIEYKFPFILSYVHFNKDFPTEFMNKIYSQGKIVELTYQITYSDNRNLFNYTPNLDIYRGLKDDEIRKFAKSAKEFGHPFLFRLNNEMNTDWTSYSGIVNMSDPEIYIDNWHRFYRIFEEEEVNNVIWIFNPNDLNFPPCNWNNFLAYYPGNQYVQMIGLTGYNTGTYYQQEMGEHWREFNNIYDNIQRKYQPFFNEFPWIITEFSSSSVGGDKVKWISNMFKHIDKYKNIKIAVWFSFADYDFRHDKNGQVARPYWLDETPETIEEFKKGLKN